MFRARNLGSLLLAVLAGCGSAPTHFYTLLPPASTDAESSAPFSIHVEPIVVPAEVDQEAWLVRASASRVIVLDNERWAAPLSNELHAAFIDALQRALGAREIDDATPSSKPTYTLRIVVRRFESVPGQYAEIDADWTVRNGSDHLACTSRVSQPVGAGYEALATGHQQSVGAIAGQLANAIRSFELHQAACPPGATTS